MSNSEINYEGVSEEEIIKNCLLADIPVFLHGASSDGKSSRIKQIDPDCEIIYLRNATPESLNGKSVYIQPITKRIEVPVERTIIDKETNLPRKINTLEHQEVIIKEGSILDIKPTWLVNLESKCQNEPDKLHILFFDELTNALPSIQGMAFNIVLDKEVNGKWKLPNNVRIVAAGNEVADSLAANKMAEPLFNRFAHVYIKTTFDSWIKWAVEHNIHPAILSFMAYTNGAFLRTKYNGVVPNADPRKWEMASKILYETGRVSSLSALINDFLVKQLSIFCRKNLTNLITLKMVIDDNYDENVVQKLSHYEIMASLVLFLKAKPNEYNKVKHFLENFEPKYLTWFQNFWIDNEEKEKAVSDSVNKQEETIKVLRRSE